ncbi:Gp15 family bacteriophage protein [Furfurilactobacillus sp. WILCCON 0119]
MSFTQVKTNYVDFKNHRYQLDLSFRIVLLYFQLIKDEGLTEKERIELAVKALVASDTSGLDVNEKAQLLDAIFKQKLYTEREKRREKLFRHSKTSFDFDADEDLIKAGFQQQYGIDLDSVTLSWSKFSAMLEGLTDDTQFRKVTTYRSIKLNDDMSDEQKELINQMKLLYSLDNTNHNGKLTQSELELELAGLDMPHKAIRRAELIKAGKI